VQMLCAPMGRGQAGRGWCREEEVPPKEIRLRKPKVTACRRAGTPPRFWLLRRGLPVRGGRVPWLS
jgi:hypothetical protein